MKKGFTLVELLGVIILLGLVGLIIVPSITKLVKDSRQDLYETQVKMIEESARKWGVQNTDLLSSTKTTYLDLSNLINKGFIEQDEIKDPRNDNYMNGCILINYNTQSKKYKYVYNDKACADIQNAGSEYADYIVSEGVNKPRLAPGMTAIKWNGSTWETVDDPDNDFSWYDYTNKEWANAQTADGSFWVWIPRYAYQIASNYHTDVVGTINIEFLIDDTNENINQTVIEETATYSGSSQTNYIKHPAFTFGTTELTGIWVAKFEMSPSPDSMCYNAEEWSEEKYEECNVDTITPTSVPNVSSWRYVNIGNAFNATRNMETNSIYGWGTTGSGIDTHMMKNIEWGAVAYLYKSVYGKSAEIWINPSEDFITGCSGNAVSVYYSEGCPNRYQTTNGQQASTTGNIYGIYDMSGGSLEYVMGNYNNTAGSSVVSPNSISDKYIDIYSTYNNAINIKGDAIYETSSYHEESSAWFGDWTQMVEPDYPWFTRGGYVYDGGESGYGCTAAGAGIFNFVAHGGYDSDYVGFRSVLVVDPVL